MTAVKSAATVDDDKPWLARPDWAARKIYRLNGMRGYTIVLLVASLGLPCLMTAILAEDTETRVMAMLGIAGTVAVILSWLLDQRFGTPVCIPHTLPGVIGGQFKATVEAKLPRMLDGSVAAKLKNVVSEDGYTTVWQTECVAPLSTLIRGGDGRCTIPVRFDIPKRANVPYAPITLPLVRSYGEWHLVVTIKMPIKNFSATFSVPVFATDKVASHESPMFAGT